jgi:hypothetical protein
MRALQLALGIMLILCAAQPACAQVPVVDPQPAAVTAPMAEAERELSPEEKMRQRWPQPVKVGDLIGLRVLDWRDSTIGFVHRVVRTPAGKVQLVVNNGYLFGRGGRLVPVPIEVVAILARQIAALDMPREEFDSAPTWTDASGRDIPPGETIRIAITRR